MRWLHCKVGVDENNVPIKIKVLKGGEIDTADLNNKFGDVEVSKIEVNQTRNIKQTKKCRNRRWRVLEFVKNNQPTAMGDIAKSQNKKYQNIKTVVRNLVDNGWLKREDNDYFKERTRLENVYFLGSMAENFIEKLKIDSFLYPQNPFDEGENGQRSPEILKRKMRKVKARV